MQIFNSHSHTCFPHDGIGSIEELCRSAISKNLLGFAVTDHCDCEYANNKSMSDNLAYSFKVAKKYQSLYKDKLIISCGIEIGEAIFNPGFANKTIASQPWDVVLGSVHAVRTENLDMPFSLIDFSDFSYDITNKYIEQYFVDMSEMIDTQDFDILSHLTVVLRYIFYKYNKPVDISKFFHQINDILIRIINKNKCLEVNTSGLNAGYLMPDIDILKLYKSLGGKNITVGSDSHTPEAIADGLENGINILKNLGFDSLTYFIDRKPVTYKI